MSRRLPLVALVGILLVAATLRFAALDASSLWSDEGNTWALIQRPLAAIAADAAADIHPPGYYWLLKGWSALAGTSAAGMRSFSAALGALLVAAVYAIGRRVEQSTAPGAPRAPVLALTAAWLAAVNPFQVYYSQEARMYLLLALAGAGLFWALLDWQARAATGRTLRPAWLGFVAAGTVGIWTHYSFPILLSGAGLAYLLHWLGVWPRRPRGKLRDLLAYTGANLTIILLFLPWLPIAFARVLAWPKGGVVPPLGEGIALTLRTLTVGPLRDLPAPLWPWLVGAGVLALLGAVALLRAGRGHALLLWLLAPVGLMIGLGLFSDAFLKFLLTAAPAWALLMAAAPWLLPWPRAAAGLVAIGGAALALFTLPAYYTGPTVRDNYAGVARYIAAVGDPAADLTLLNAPGQGDVWGYYDPGLPVLKLPASRPPDPAATLAELTAAATGRRTIFALFWATDEADPDRLVESWLDQHTFRGLESWQGNLRFVVYSQAPTLTCGALPAPAPFGDAIALTAVCQPTLPQQIPAGQVALVELRWQARAPIATRAKVTVQLLDPRNQVIAQHDAEPAGGSRPTDGWQVGETVRDNHGLPIPFGAPPGRYRLIVALYDPATGARLPTSTGDALELGEIVVTRPAFALPHDVLPIQHRIGQRVPSGRGPLTLVGYDAYRKDSSHAPDTPLIPGDLVHFTFYWAAPDPLPANWPADLDFTLQVGDATLRAPLAGGLYPTGEWQAHELVRGEFDILYDGTRAAPRLTVAGETLRLRPLPR